MGRPEEILTAKTVNFLDPSASEAFIQRAFAANEKRLQHILIVSDRVRQSARDINELHLHIYLSERLAYCAALVHDIGYLEDLRITGFHPWDGYHYLKNRGFPELASLIVGHSCSPEEAQLLKLPAIDPSSHLAAKLLTYWDMQVKQGGEVVSYDERLADIIARYGEKSIVGRANLLAEPRIRKIISEINDLLGRV